MEMFQDLSSIPFKTVYQLGLQRPLDPMPVPLYRCVQLTLEDASQGSYNLWKSIQGS
jgi:hypothetical protein